MIKVFISHSSKDKATYVNQVVTNLKKNNIVYDELTFEYGMRAIDEIISGIDESSLFVVFLSENSINSDWVKKELLVAKDYLDQNKIDRIYPILIDKSISYSDARIPEWVRNEYNLRLITRPTLAARNIQQRLREISWIKHPLLKERKKIFVGRNDIVRCIEERMDDFDSPTPSVLIASGLVGVGRSSVLKNAIEKYNIVKSSYEYPHIVLVNGESIEDLIIKLYDLGLSEQTDIYNLLNVSFETKIGICYKLINDIQSNREVLLVHDDGCLIDYKGDIKWWFDELAKMMQENNKLQWIVASTKRIKPNIARINKYIFSVNVPELSVAERKGLFKRVLQLYSIDLDSDNINKFSGLLTGFPDQVFFACDQLHDLGITDSWKKANDITNFNNERASIILSCYSDNQDILDFIYLLSKFEFISHQFLYTIEDRKELQEVLSELIVKSICDYVGRDKEFIRLNDSIRDYIQRNKLVVPKKYLLRLQAHLNDFLDNPSNYEDDISDILYSIKESIKSGKTPPDKYLIPSHFLKSIRELYHNKKNINKVIELSYQFLKNETLLDKDIVHDVRYYLCLALARKREDTFLTEVQKIAGPEHDFLMGFYYRLKNRPKDAIDRFNKCLQDSVVANRSKRELVQVFISVNDYQAAASLAKDNYNDYPNNKYHIQAYVNTIINSNDKNKDFKLIEKLINELDFLGTDISKEMAKIAHAEYIAKCKNDYPEAKNIIADAVSLFRESHYPLLSQAFLAARFMDEETLVNAFNKLKNMRNISAESLYQLEASIIAIQGDSDRAISLVGMKLNNFPDNSVREIISRLAKMTTNK